MDNALLGRAEAPKVRKPKGLVVALFLFALLSIVLGVTLVIEIHNSSSGGVSYATCMVRSASPGAYDNVTGTITIQRTTDGTHITGEIQGLIPSQRHGIHVHNFGATAAEGEEGNVQSVGAHFNPGNKRHGCLDSTERHAGDLGNVNANSAGDATVDITDDQLQLGGEYSVLGRSIVLARSPDDCTTQPDGGASQPYAHCTIEAGNV